MHVLFVCNSNVCRSVIAERLARAFAADNRLPGLTAESAGTRALVGFPAEPLAAETIAGLGGHTEGFKARKLRPEMVDRADLVLTMTEALRDQVGELGFGAAARTFTLPEAHRIAKVTGAKSIAALHRARNDLAYVGRENIADPIGLSAEAFLEIGDRIAELLFPLLGALAPYNQAGHGTDERLGLVIEPRPARPLSTFLAAQRGR
ncbi:low molecular weight phosphatase family protein [Nocardia mangyaensis]|uniref:Low molecular weight phosphatase family protein n=1 Tax=Nocardia mangyaensis TaxID=2213200 RepID=A0A1J0W1N7_9NOCA|nr:low molecular weight phosphatase family protein [Nocardia mangyaensis]APE38182.1 low molecular weight phosphatase family protein [Nocardia mangyaensis]